MKIKCSSASFELEPRRSVWRSTFDPYSYDNIVIIAVSSCSSGALRAQQASLKTEIKTLPSYYVIT